MVRGDWAREPFSRNQWLQDRVSADNSPIEPQPRYHEPNDARRPPLNIEKALREHCNIPARYYFVAAILDDGTAQTFSGPGRFHLAPIETFFSMDAFRRQVKRAESAASPIHEDDPHGFTYGPGFAQHSLERRRQGSEAFGDDDHVGFGPRKRSRGNRRPINDDDGPTVTVGATKRALRIGDSREVWDFYDQRFRNCQQTACKLIAKAWVKVVEPKKQTNHPYTGQDEKAPEWWPKPWGPTKDEKVRHKEPDHLYKKERVHLLCHILRMIVEPNEKQHPSIRKMKLDIQKLKEATDEALSSFFSGKENEKNAKKKPYLDEIFKVALQEQRYKHGEIDGDSLIYVMAEDRFPETGISENDDGGILTKEDGDPPSVPSSASPSKASQHDVLLHRVHGSNTDHSQGGHMQGGGSFVGEVAVREPSHYAAQMLPPTMHSEAHFVQGGNLQHPSGGLPMHDLVPSPQDGQRRTSIFGSPAEYSNAPPAAAVYTPAWHQQHQQHPGTTAPDTTSMYSFPSHPPAAATQGHFGGHPNVPVAQGQYMGSQYDGLARGNFDQATLFRHPAGPSPAQVQGPQGYPAYLPPDGRSMSSWNPDAKAEPIARPTNSHHGQYP
ncbi:hypothetical protein SODALDRAFT_94609 [Sodiomyces alkalinus F11]|uniref:Subtelomeric hrmA-associated cluster protein AFUB-079030/YDR124W-like helical bundle domain-containing protein n=1 Tax=Sodiomyces alkalinus (strain CBS 110278 / VKM F-3762 / F11) TaxID=1314773 RepID=A0A3N2Q0Q7_SODAK|nr:hypothetical protein SODALDRAFT_94609 [Sodiomyces alkalinus F11]ROT40354.1 hypothetical protein SODALDRAFT_94609 [Sodiomyces alkalinus F11]